MGELEDGTAVSTKGETEPEGAPERVPREGDRVSCKSITSET